VVVELTSCDTDRLLVVLCSSFAIYNVHFLYIVIYTFICTCGEQYEKIKMVFIHFIFVLVVRNMNKSAGLLSLYWRKYDNINAINLCLPGKLSQFILSRVND
jgi:hypothetical protein